MNKRLTTIVGIIISITLSACNKSESPTPSDIQPQPAQTTQTQPAQPETNIAQNTEQQHDVQAPANQQVQNTEQPQNTEQQPDTVQPQIEQQDPALQGDERIFQIENADELKALIKEGVNVNTRAEDGSTLLFDLDLDFAKDSDYTKAIELAQILIDAGIDINAKDKDGKTVLFNLYYGDSAEEYIKLLLDHGADVKVKANDGTTVLFAATDKEVYEDNCSPKSVKLLIDAGADINAKNKKGQTYLEAADKGCKDKFMIAFNMPLELSLSEKDITKILSEMGVKAKDVNKPDESGLTPLFYAKTKEQAAALIASGADVNYQNEYGETPLFSIVQDASDPLIIKVLADAGADVNHRDKDGKTAIFNAEDVWTIRMLAKCGADILFVYEYPFSDIHDGELASEHIREVFMRELNIDKKYSSTLDKIINELKADMNAANGVTAKADQNEKIQDKPSEDTTTDNMAVQPPPAPPIKEEKKFEETVIPPATGEIACTSWNNALFVDGSELYYKIKVEQSDDSNANDDNPVTELEFYVLCHVKLNYATDIYCGSTVTCELEPKYNKDKYKEAMKAGLPVEGTWFIDKNGIYYFNKDQFKELVKTTDIGNCKTGHPAGSHYVNYVKCIPETLAWEYKQFKEAEPLIPLSPDVKVYEVLETEAGTTKKTVSRTGTVLCYHNAFEGEDEFVDDICVDDTKGPTSFKKVSTSDFTMKGTLKVKKAK